MIFCSLGEIDGINPISSTQKIHGAKGERFNAESPGREVVRIFFMVIFNPLLDEISQLHQPSIAIVSVVYGRSGKGFGGVHVSYGLANILLVVGEFNSYCRFFSVLVEGG